MPNLHRWSWPAPFVALVLAGCLPHPDDAETVEQPIVGGTMASACMWPTCVTAGGCTNTLIHPKIVTTARHCLGGTPRAITFGESRTGAARMVQIERCVRSPTSDIGFCILKEEVNDVPIVPVLAACEAQQMIRRGQPAVLVGFGNLRSGMSSGGRKYFVGLTINALVGGGREVDLGDAQMGACNGDSGGPAYLRMPDGTWRAFGVTSRKGPGGSNCASSTIYGLISAHIEWIESQSGLDITPCHGPNGWEGGPACDNFPTDPGGTSGGTWTQMCSKGPVAKPMPTCTGNPPPPVPDGGAPPPSRDARADGRSDARGNAGRDASAEEARVSPPLSPDAAADLPPPRPDLPPPAPMTADAAPPPEEVHDAARPATVKPPETVGGCRCSLGRQSAGARMGLAPAAVGAFLLFIRSRRRRRGRAAARDVSF